MTEMASMVLIVDDDPSARAAMGRLLGSAGYRVESFASAGEFLARGRPAGPCCLLLDLRLPDASGLELQQLLASEKVHVPIVFISGFGDVPSSVRAMKAGAMDFLTKPFDEKELLGAVERAIAEDRQQMEGRQRDEDLRRRFAALTDREREVLALVVSGMLNKQVGQRLGVTEKTIKVHRARVMEKMQADSLAELVRMAESLGVGVEDRQTAAVTGEPERPAVSDSETTKK